MPVTIAIVPAPDLTPALLSESAIGEMALGLGCWVNAPHGIGPASAYGQGAYTIRAVARGAAVPKATDHIWLLWLKTRSDVQGAAGYHDVIDGSPAMFVFIEDILAAGMSTSAVASHEIAECLIDPWVNNLIYANVDGQDRAYTQELCDPVERFGTLFQYGNGQHIEVSEFVLKPYFFWGNSGPYSSLGNCPGPLTPALGGRQAWAPIGAWSEAQVAPLVPEAAPATRRHVSALHDAVARTRNTPAGT